MAYRFFISISFDGTAYRGWQIQPGNPTVQSEVEKALGLILGGDIQVTGAGRTDTGVHARSFMAHFETDLPEESIKARQLVYKLNRVLPGDIAINAIYPVPPLAHARFDALKDLHLPDLHP